MSDFSLRGLRWHAPNVGGMVGHRGRGQGKQTIPAKIHGSAWPSLKRQSYITAATGRWNLLEIALCSGNPRNLGGCVNAVRGQKEVGIRKRKVDKSFPFKHEQHCGKALKGEEGSRL